MQSSSKLSEIYNNRIMDIIRSTIIEYYGQLTWITLSKYIGSKGVNSVSELLGAIKEFFGGSEEVLNIVLSRCQDKCIEAEDNILRI